MAQLINLMGTSKWIRSLIWWLHPNGSDQFGSFMQMARVINLVGTSYGSCHKYGGYIQMAQFINLVATSNWPRSSI